MTEQKDFINISPEVGGVKGLRNTVFQETEWDQIRDNPKGLTKEGILKSIENWKKSSNKHVVLKYQAMLVQCKNIASSGLDEDGKIIFTRGKDGKPYWVDELSSKKIKKEKEKE